MEYIPVFNYFDVYVKYDGHEIEQYTMYLVKVSDDSIENKILFGATYSRCYGNKLTMIKSFKIKYEIL
jgi:hypothetical protein